MPLNVHCYGPAVGPRVLALHGVAGHGRQWESLTREYLPEFRVLAPDLRGHGRSPAEPPWNLERLADDAAEVLDGPAVLVGHSFGGAVALHLARRHPKLVSGLLLLDPALGIPAEQVLRNAQNAVAYPDYTDVAEARAEQLGEAWKDVPVEVLEAELTEHLVPTEDGRVGWRICLPAVAACWGEMARPFVLPPAGLPTVLVQAKTPVVGSEFRQALSDFGAGIHEFDCDHMVAQARPVEVAALVRELT